MTIDQRITVLERKLAHIDWDHLEAYCGGQAAAQAFVMDYRIELEALKAERDAETEEAA